MAFLFSKILYNKIMIKNSYPGKFIVIEGIDGAGGETQTKLLFNYLKKKRKPVEKLSYPDYQGPIGKLIHQFLHRKYDFSPEVQFLLYSTDFLKDKEKIKMWLERGKFIIADRYFTTTLAYQGLKGFQLKEALKFAEIFALPKPNLIVYLKISPETSIKRKLKEKKNLDRHEANKKFLSKLTNFYKELIKNQIFGEWIIINGERSIEEVSEEIKKLIDLKFKL
jgi:dTMP kinase